MDPFVVASLHRLHRLSFVVAGVPSAQVARVDTEELLNTYIHPARRAKFMWKRTAPVCNATRGRMSLDLDHNGQRSH